MLRNGIDKEAYDTLKIDDCKARQPVTSVNFGSPEISVFDLSLFHKYGSLVLVIVWINKLIGKLHIMRYI